jgi:hypothetical protein
MPKCRIAGCKTEAGINPKTGMPNMLCKEHFLESRGSRAIAPKASRKFSGVDKGKGPNRKPKASSTAPKVDLFVLRGRTLTINYTGKTKHVNVDRLTRAVKYNDDKEGTSGKMFHYVIEVKQGIEKIADILFDNKAERDREFAKLQALLSSVY